MCDLVDFNVQTVRCWFIIYKVIQNKEIVTVIALVITQEKQTTGNSGKLLILLFLPPPPGILSQYCFDGGCKRSNISGSKWRTKVKKER